MVSSSRSRGVQDLLNDVGARHADCPVAGDLAGLCNRTLHAVGDDRERRVGAGPAVGNAVGDDEHGHAERVVPAPTLGEVEKSPADHECAGLRDGVSQVGGAGRCDVRDHVVARPVDVDLAIVIPVEDVLHPVV